MRITSFGASAARQHSGWLGALGAVAALGVGAGVATVASAAPVTWDTSQGGNGNTYDVILDASASWDAARVAAQAAGGDLVTISSQQEQDFVESVLSANAADTGSYWFGIREAAEGVYQHVNGQALGFANWAPNQPDNSQGSESVGAILWATDADAAADPGMLARRGGWNDAPVSGYPADGLVTPPADALRAGYLIEIAATDDGGGGGGDDGGTAVPLPAGVLAFPLGAAFAGIFYRRMRRGRGA
jgi:hypothetical protein